MDTADCAIGIDAANLVLMGLRGFRDDYEEHILHHRCLGSLKNPVPCEARCRRNMVDDALNIRGLKLYAVDHAGNVPQPKKAPATGKPVAIIAAAPAASPPPISWPLWATRSRSMRSRPSWVA